MTRTAHYLKVAKGCESPHSVIFVDTETRPTRPRPGVMHHNLWFGWACYERTRRGHDWCEAEWFRFETPTEFWSWAETKARPETKTYLFAHNWAFDAPVLQTFSLLPAKGWRLTRAIIESPPVVLSWTDSSRTLEMLDTLNWWKVPLRKIGESVNRPKLPMPGPRASKEEWDRYCRNDVEVIRAVLKSWWAFLIEHDLGTFTRTLASQSFRAYRHRFMDEPILIDSDARSAALARDGYHGGRTECFRLGRVKGPIYAYDVNSAYPAVMATEVYPRRFIRRLSHARISDLKRWLRDYAVVARVLIRTRRPRFAHLHDGKVCFPIGRFVATLTTRDLREALEAGEVQAVQEVALYEGAPLFRRFVADLYRLRLAAQSAGNTVQAWLLKILLNSLYGKFGQRGRVWEVIGPAPDQSVKVWIEYDVVDGTYRELRQFGGVQQVHTTDAEARDSHPAIAAHVTADARALLWRYMEQAGRDNVVYCDTDSLYVTSAGSARLQSAVHPTNLGALKLEGTYPWVEIHGAKDYATPSFSRTKGVTSKAKWLNDSTVQQEQWSSLSGLVRAGSLDAPVTTTIVKHLARIYTKGIRQRDGRVLPLRLSESDSPARND